MTKKAFGNPSKWVDSIKSQLEDIENSSVNTQFINIEQVVLDPNNSRIISISPAEIKGGPKINSVDFNLENQESFENVVKEYFKNSENAAIKIRDYMELARLAASIKNPENLMNPITVYIGNHMQFNLIAGHRRTLAHYLLDSKRICARILEKKPSEFEKNLLQWSENQDREDLSLFEQLQAINKIIASWESLNNCKITLGKLIALLSIRKTKAAWFLKLNKTDDTQVLDLIKNGTINSLETAYKLLAINDSAQKSILINEIISGNITNLKNIKNTMVRPPNQQNQDMSANRFGGRTRIKFRDIDIKLKSQIGHDLFSAMINTLHKSDFSLNLTEKNKKLWVEIVKDFSEVEVNA